MEECFAPLRMESKRGEREVGSATLLAGGELDGDGEVV